MKRIYLLILFLYFPSSFASSITSDGLTFHLFSYEDEAYDFCFSTFYPYHSPFTYNGALYPYLTQTQKTDLSEYSFADQCKSSNSTHVAYKYLGSPPSGTPEEQCTLDGLYWYNNQCNNSPQPTPEEQCTLDGLYWYNNQCNLSPDLSTSCVTLADSSLVLNLSGAGANLNETICHPVPGVSGSGNCLFQEVGGTNNYTDSSGTGWAGTFQGLSESCVSAYDPLPLTNDCSANDITVDTDSPTPQVLSFGSCDYQLQEEQSLNSFNGCKTLYYVGISGSIGAASTHLESLNSCNPDEVLTCELPQVLSEDGLTCVSIPNDSGSFSDQTIPLSFSGDWGNPSSLFSITTVTSYPPQYLEKDNLQPLTTEYPAIDTSARYTAQELSDYLINLTPDLSAIPASFDHQADGTTVMFYSNPQGLRAVYVGANKVHVRPLYEGITYNPVGPTTSNHSGVSFDCISGCSGSSYHALVATISHEGYGDSQDSTASGGEPTTSGSLTQSQLEESLSQFSPDVGQYDDVTTQYSDGPGGFMPPTFTDSIGSLESAFYGSTCNGQLDCVPSQGIFTVDLPVTDSECSDFSGSFDLLGHTFEFETSYCQLLEHPEYKPYIQMLAYLTYFLIAIVLVFTL